jgi:hypothetical protein
MLMNPDPGEHAKAARRTYLFSLVLLATAVIAAIPRLSLGSSQFVEYDGYWHVWIAQHDRWANFIWDYRANAHPPLYFLLLRMSFWLGRNQLAYRSVSLIAGLAAVYVLGRTAQKATRSLVWAALAALAYGLAMPSILISNEVRTYMLSALFVQISFYYFLDLTGVEQPASKRPRVIFAVAATLACLTEYYALIYVAAAMLLAFALPIVRRDKAWGKAVLRELATFGLALALPVWEYISHFGAQGVAFAHLPDFYSNIDGKESELDFLWRNLRNELNIFSPWPVPAGPIFVGVLGGLLIALVAAIVLVRKLSEPRNAAAMVSLLMPLIMLGAIMAAALIPAYPFGGFLRQQFVLFSFAAVCPFLLLDRLTAPLPRSVTVVLAGLLAAAIALVSMQRYEAWPKISRLLLTDQMERYNRLFPRPESIYIDQFNLTSFFMHHHDWKWQFEGTLPNSTTVDVYRLTSRDKRSMLLFRDKNRWNLDLQESALFASIANGLRAQHMKSTTIFDLSQSPGPLRSEAKIAAYKDKVAELSAAEGLCVQTLDIDNYDAYGEFRLAGTCDSK